MVTARTFDAYGSGDTVATGARTGFSGEVMESTHAWYLLGERFYVPAFRQFVSPDAASPFDNGGLNRYAYCSGDPVNRIDPEGTAWWDWLGAGLGLLGAVVGTLITGGALLGALGAAGSLTAAVATTGMATTTLAAALDVVAVVAEMGSIASMATNNAKLAGVFGWMGLGSGAASAIIGVGKTVQGTRRLLSPRRGISRSPIIPASEAPPERLVFSPRTGSIRLKTGWYRHTEDGQTAVTHIVADTTVTNRRLKHPLKMIARMPVVDGHQNVYLYSGVHGAPEGRNWPKGKRNHGDPRVLQEDMDNFAAYQQRIPDRQLIVEDIADISAQEMLDRWERPGIHLHASCYAAVDELLLTSIGKAPVPVYTPTWDRV